MLLFSNFDIFEIFFNEKIYAKNESVISDRNRRPLSESLYFDHKANSAALCCGRFIAIL